MDYEKLANELYDKVLNYVDTGINKTRECCTKHRWACLRFKRFINDERYYFDKKELLKFYVWSTQFTHRAGVLKGEPFILSDYLLWLASNILCIKYKKNNLRKTNTVYVQVGRKNAKSQFMACLVSYFLFTKGNQEIYLSGWDKSGSDIVFREIEHQLSSSKFLKGKWKKAYGKLINLKDKGYIWALSREAKNNDNANNPSLAIVDEYKDHLTSEIWDNLKTGMIGRPDGLIITITTAGSRLFCPCKNVYDICSKILNPDIDIEDDSYFIDVHEMEENDDISDSNLWIKANPIVATYKEGIENLKKAYNLAKLNEDSLRTFLTKNMNIWVDMAENGYMNMTKWKECTGEFKADIFKGVDVYCGVDLSAKWDLTSVVFGAKVGSKFYFIHQSFMPQFRYNELISKGEDYWYNWKMQGYLQVLNSETIDINFIIKYIEDFRINNNLTIKEIDYDSWSATQFAREMENLGYETVEIRQGIRTLGEGTKRFKEEVLNGNIVHQKDGLYSFAFSNAILREDTNKNFMVDKKNSKNKIDPVCATMNIASRIFAVEDEVNLNEFVDKFFEMFE